jgi:hypothetical protein
MHDNYYLVLNVELHVCMYTHTNVHAYIYTRTYLCTGTFCVYSCKTV